MRVQTVTRGEPMRIKRACKECVLEAVKVPVVEIPILVKQHGVSRVYPHPVRLQARFGLCLKHAAAFTMDKWTDFGGSWYEMVCDQVRERKRPAINPFPEDPGFKWEEWVVDPKWEAAPLAACIVKFYEIAALQGSRGMHERLF